MKLTIYWITDNPDIKQRIREKFKMPFYTSVNGETDCEINEDVLPLLKETENRGFIKIRKK